MKNTILKTKYFITGLLIGLTIIGLQAFAVVPGAGTIGSLFQQVGNSYKLIGTNITDNSITSTQIALGTINKVNLNSDSVGTLEVINNSLTAADLANNSVGNGELANNSVNSAKVIDNSLTAADLANNSVGNGELANNSVNSVKVINNSLTAADLATNSVGSLELANNSVNSAKVINNSLTANDLANNSVGNGELANNSVNSAAVIDGSITESDLASTVVNKINNATSGNGPVTVCNSANLGMYNNNGYICKRISVTNYNNCLTDAKDNAIWSSKNNFLDFRCFNGYTRIMFNGWRRKGTFTFLQDKTLTAYSYSSTYYGMVYIYWFSGEKGGKY